MDWSELIARWDSPTSLFYLDPPYHGGETDYGKGMSQRADFEKVAKQLATLKGTFIMSINEVPEIREIFSGFHMDEVRLSYTIAVGAAKKVGKLIISNKEAVAGFL